MATIKKAKKSKSLIVAEYFIKKNQEDNKGLTNKKLQKLLYYSQAWSLALKGRRIFPDNIEAWVHGPTVPAVYHSFKEFGSGEIDTEVEDRDISTLSIEERKLLDSIWEVYGKYEANYLEALTHSEKPWQEARRGLGVLEVSNSIISTKIMKDYYGEKIQETRKRKGEKRES